MRLYRPTINNHSKTLYGAFDVIKLTTNTSAAQPGLSPGGCYAVATLSGLGAKRIVREFHMGERKRSRGMDE